MNLRAFQLQTMMVAITGFLFAESLYATNCKGNKEEVIPYEVKFANVAFQLNNVTHYLLQSEVAALESNKLLLQQKLEKLGIYMKIAEHALIANNIPDDFKFLMLYNKYQQTPSLSTDLDPSIFWCLSSEAAGDVALRVDDKIDERKHIMAATRGGVLCLKRNFVLYNNWASVLFAHIADKKILQNLAISKNWNDASIIQLDSPVYSSLLQFLALKIVLERKFPAYKQTALARLLYEYPYGKNKTLQKVSDDLKIDLAELERNNQWFTSTKVPESNNNVLVVVQADAYNQTKILAELAQNKGNNTEEIGFPLLKRNLDLSKGKGGVFYEINNKTGLQAEMCDNIVTMAYKANMSIRKFLELNDMNDKDLLHVGAIYYTEKKENKAAVPFHVVRTGETLWDIAQMYGVRLESLLIYNRLEKVQRLQRGRLVWMQAIRPMNKPIEFIELPELLEPEETPSEDVKNEILTEDLKTDHTEKLLTKNDNSINEVVVQPAKTELPENLIKPIVEKSKLEPIKTTAQAYKVENVPSYEPNTYINSGVIIIGDTKTRTKKIENIYSENIAGRVVAQTNENEAAYVFHVVKKDETLYRISVNYNVSVDNLRRLNNLSSNTIEIGEQLKVKKQ